MRALIAVVLLVATTTGAATIDVTEGQSIQAAIDAAQNGDTIAVGPGTFPEDLDFQGKAVIVRGAGPATIVAGTGTTSVVRFATGEGPGSVLDSVTVTNGLAVRGGGIYVLGASPTIVRTTVIANRAFLQGSGLYLESSNARLYNNLIAYNTSAGGDPHSLQIIEASPTVVNNTITRGDSNGILVSGISALPTIMNNIIAYNGSRPRGEEARGRGICDFGPATAIQWNLFFRNRKAALLSGAFVDYRRVRTAQLAIAQPRLANNLDGSPRFVAPLQSNFALRPGSRAMHAGNPDPAFDDHGGTRNTMGHLGGPFAAPSTAIP